MTKNRYTICPQCKKDTLYKNKGILLIDFFSGYQGVADVGCTNCDFLGRTPELSKRLENAEDEILEKLIEEFTKEKDIE